MSPHILSGRHFAPGPRPEWGDTPYVIYAHARAANCRINRFRLTEQEASELRAYTGRDDILLGYPVEIKHTLA
jgi:hypothetical protein